MCTRPIKAISYYFYDKITGEYKRGVKPLNCNLNYNFIKDPELINLKCGSCYECLNEHSIEWSYRIMLEASLYKDNCFITLTYNDSHLVSNSLVKEDYVKFLKRLRRKIEPLKIRYFLSGEYGSKGKRPHYHLIIFGWRPDDLKYFGHSKKGQNMYRSKMLETLWNKGFVSVGNVSLHTAKYTAQYMQKLSYRLLDQNLDNLEKPFIRMSTHPGIGLNAVSSNVLKTDKIYFDGSFIKTPRYYLDKLLADNYDEVEKVKQNRIRVAKIFALNDSFKVDKELIEREESELSRLK